VFCDSSCGSSVAAMYMNLVQCRPIISRHFMCDKKFIQFFAALAPDPGDATAHLIVVTTMRIRRTDPPTSETPEQRIIPNCKQPS